MSRISKAILAQEIDTLRQGIRELTQRIWVLENPPKFKYGDVVPRGKIVDIDTEVNFFGVTVVPYYQYTIDTGEGLTYSYEEQILEDIKNEKDKK